MDYFTNEYLCGRTPNPCIRLQPLCESGKRCFSAVFHWSGLHCDRTLCKNRTACQWTVCDCNSVTAAKDQTYALYNLTQEQLSHTLMPVGDYTKDQIREIADKNRSSGSKKEGFPGNLLRAGSGLRFLYPERDRNLAPKGNFVNTKGEILGTHEGITHYTVGQRRGLGLPMGHRVFVLEIRPETNEVVVGENEEVFAKVVKANKVNYMAIPPLELGEELSCTAKIRYGHKGSPCVIKRTGEDEITCTFPDGVRAPTPGQAVVFYVDGCVGGGGTITEAER